MERPHKVARAIDLLSDAACVRRFEETNTLRILKEDRDNRWIDSPVSDEELKRRASNAGFHAQASNLLHCGLAVEQFNELDTAMTALQHPNGPGWTKMHGNLRIRNGNAQQRARNTRLENQPIELLSSDE